MAMNIKDPEAERLAAEVAELTGETKTAAVRNALRERRDRLAAKNSAKERGERLVRFLREEIWPHVPPEVRGTTITKAEREEILGYGPDGV
jgi:antitoxin VapB